MSISRGRTIVVNQRVNFDQISTIMPWTVETHYRLFKNNMKGFPKIMLKHFKHFQEICINVLKRMSLRVASISKVYGQY